ncbi:Telomerase protein component 1 [Neocucurbitaria cava]|uniref:phosphatidylinositol-3,4,5-trisphosphate 3-phosphatase n=1 Tax=Neocucurbitaria cava TaxID=798079 RepID=A0A9W8Y139_9PLEO|nr:Telomerase protein component 1 [Neocucurbitaria cava]
MVRKKPRRRRSQTILIHCQASLLRQIVAGPRARHPEAGLDLCYVTDNIIATSGPSGTYPQRAYRNPLDSLVKFLDSKHGEDWAIWEFRAEGTGYPDSEVYNRVYHYPFPDHHPPPFALIPNIMASMRNWLHEKDGRVVVVHCKAGKGRSGTASCSYLISEEGWPVHKALNRFTERRMRPNMGKGVSIPSQLRWIGYVDRWAKHGKLYVEKQVEILEVHCWGLRDGVKIQIEGFVDDGKLIKNFHTFTKDEREIVRGEVKTTGMAQAVQEVMYKNGFGPSQSKKDVSSAQKDGSKNASSSSLDKPDNLDGAAASRKTSQESLPFGTGDVVFRPAKRVVLPTNDINIDVERRNKAAFDLTMVTAVAHVWFNAYFEGHGPEKNGNADESGIFEIDWEAMDGIKGSSRKGTQAFERIAVVWRALSANEGRPGIVITEPKEGEEVHQPAAADWRGAQGVEPGEGKDLGVRTGSPTDSQADISRASSVRSENKKSDVIAKAPGRDSSDSDTQHVRSHGPNGEEILNAPSPWTNAEASGSGPAASASDPVLPSQTDGTSSTASDSRPQDPESHRDGGHVEKVTGSLKYHVSGAASTSDLPDGKPEHDMKNAKEHGLGHLHMGKKKSSS